jgi:cytoskeleton protein RodZ
MNGAEQPAGAPATEPPRPGHALAQAREQRGQSVAEVAQQLKLSPHQVEALEADDYERLPGPVFVRGFVRNYARLLNLDPQPLLSRLESPPATTSALNAVPHSQNIPFEGGRRARWQLLAAAVALLAAVVLLFEWLLPEKPHAPAPELPAAAPLPAPAAVASAVLDTPVAEAQPAAPPPAEPLAAQAAAPTAPALPSPAPATAGGAELRFVFERQSWVEVRDRNDRVLFSQLNPAGAVQTLQGTPPLNLVIGNAAGVKLSYKGKTVDLAPYTKTDVARLTLE